MRTRYDQFGKQMVRTALATRGPVETDAEVPADTRRIDLWFMPDLTREPVPDHLGLLGRITTGSSTLADPTKRTNDDKEFLMDTQDIVENWRQAAIQEGRQEGRQRFQEVLVHLLR